MDHAHQTLRSAVYLFAELLQTNVTYLVHVGIMSQMQTFWHFAGCVAWSLN